MEITYQDEVSVGLEEVKRVQDEDIDKPLHRYIGSLQFISSKGQALKGTAFLISPNILLTAGHNIYNTVFRSYNHSFIFFRGLHGEMKNGISVEEYFVPEEFIVSTKKRSAKYDYAFLRLKKSALPLT